MSWVVQFYKKFEKEFYVLGTDIQDELLAHTKLLEHFGPSLGRPHVDTLNGSKYSKMKELRFKTSTGVWRVAFAYDPHRNAISLVAGNKAGIKSKRFYKTLLNKADTRLTEHLLALVEEKV